MCVQLFCDAQREEIKAANPGASFGETGKLLATAWKDCPAEDKARFQEQSQVCIASCDSTNQETACYHCLCCQCCILSVGQGVSLYYASVSTQVSGLAGGSHDL